MSVLIKGLEMPETGYMDVRIFRDGTAAIATGTKPYYRKFEAVDVPAPHGRLIYEAALSELVGEPIEVFLGRLDLKLPPTVDAIPIDYMRSQVDSGKWEEIITRWKENNE